MRVMEGDGFFKKRSVLGPGFDTKCASYCVLTAFANSVCVPGPQRNELRNPIGNKLKRWRVY